MEDINWLDRMSRKIILGYLFFSGLWICMSDAVLSYFVRDPGLMSRVSTLKGLAFVAVTALFLRLLLKHNLAMIADRERQYQTLADSGQALVWMSGTDKLCTWFNNTWLEFTGRPLNQELGNGWAEGVHPDDLQRCLDIYVGAFDRREKFSMEYRLRRHDGEYRWLQDDGSPRYDGSGNFIGYIGFCLDVTESRQLKVELAKSNEFMTAILDCLSDGVIACDKDGRLSRFNRSAREFHGIPEQPLPPERWAEQYDLFEKDGTTRMKMENIPLYRALMGERVSGQEMVIVPRGSKPLTLVATGRQMINDAGEKLGAVVSLHDVTMLKELEEHVRQTQKLDSIGTLAGGIAHDFNNILTVITSAAALLEMEAAGNPEQIKLVSEIRKSTERGAGLTHNLLAFGRKQPVSKKVNDIAEIVKTMQDFLGRIIGEDILFMTSLPDEPLAVMIDRGQVEQVLMSLAVNARDAMPLGGILNIEVSKIENCGQVPELEGYSSLDYAQIAVSDTGDGIDEATIKRIFEPFFTTRMLGKRSGLGLSMAYGIIRQHDGAITVSSKPGDGTTFKVYLPLRDQSETNAASITCARQHQRGTETILLVEDDQEVLAMNRGLLERSGYLVLSAIDGFEALDIFKNSSDRISLVILDVIMPGMNGKEVYEKFRDIDENVAVLFCSGYATDILSRGRETQENVNFMSKPFNPELFLKRVRSLIDK